LQQHSRLRRKGGVDAIAVAIFCVAHFLALRVDIVAGLIAVATSSQTDQRETPGHLLDLERRTAEEVPVHVTAFVSTGEQAVLSQIVATLLCTRVGIVACIIAVLASQRAHLRGADALHRCIAVVVAIVIAAFVDAILTVVVKVITELSGSRKDCIILVVAITSLRRIAFGSDAGLFAQLLEPVAIVVAIQVPDRCVERRIGVITVAGARRTDTRRWVADDHLWITVAIVVVVAAFVCAAITVVVAIIALLFGLRAEQRISVIAIATSIGAHLRFPHALHAGIAETVVIVITAFVDLAVAVVVEAVAELVCGDTGLTLSIDTEQLIRARVALGTRGCRRRVIIASHGERPQEQRTEQHPAPGVEELRHDILHRAM
jgi:hypothetical protein